MIGVIFSFGTEIIEVRVMVDKVFFRTTQSQMFASIDGIKLDKSGVLKEFPDLKDNNEWQSIARERFKDKVKEMKNEEERIKYVISDLSKFGYKPLYYQKQGFRPVKI
jgi:hypothetical protein